MRAATGNWARKAGTRLLPATLAALCALALSLAGASGAQAATYLLKGSFDEGNFNLGLAVDQSSNDVYVTNFFGTPPTGIKKFSATGQLEPPTPFGEEGSDAGVAVDPLLNHDVYAYNTGRQEIETFEPPLATKVGSFPVPGSAGVVEIASDFTGDVYYPDKETNAILKFSPAGTLEATLEGQAPVGAFKEPQGVAVDASGNVYVADTGNGRTVRIEAGTGAQSVIDTGGTQDVAVDPVSGDVFALDLSASGYHVVAYHAGEASPFAEFGGGRITNVGNPNHIAVDHETGDVYVSDFGNRVWIFAPGIPPEVTYPPAPSERVTGLTASEATLHGEVNPKGNETSCHFEYGTSTTYEHSMPCQPEPVGKGSTFEPEAVTIKGLEGNTEYHFRLVATTAGGEIFAGVDETFMTAAAPPVVAGESAGGVTRSDARLEALVNPENQPTTYHFEYATNPQFTGATALGSGTIPAEGQSVPVGPVDIGGGLQPGTTYYYRVVAENATLPATDGPIQSFTTIGKPLVNTGAAGSLSRTNAMLSGTVDPVGAESAFRFVYIDQARYQAALVEGASDPYADGWSTPAVKLAASYQTEAAGPVSIGGLLAGTTYHYALVANNEVGETTGPDKTFTTPGGITPVAVTGGASGVTANTASISAVVDTRGLPTNYGFQFGTEAGEYGPATGFADIGPGFSEVAVTLALQNLQPGTTYHYRIVASNLYGTSTGADQSFTTPGLPALLTLPATAPLIAPPAIAFPTETGTTSKPTPKALTRAQKLANALKACMKKPKKQRAGCKKQAHKQFGPAKKKKK